MIDMGMTSGTAEGFLNVQNTGAGHVTTPPEFKLLLNSSEKMRIDSSGNVGIGTTSPSAKLEVVGNILASGVTTDNIYGATYPSNSFLDFDDDQTAATNMTSLGSIGRINYLADTNNNAPTTDPAHQFFTGTKDIDTATALMTIRTDGNVGIGTTSPAYKLEVNADSTSALISVKNAANSRDTLRSENAAGTRTFNIGNDASGNGIVLVRNSSGTTTSYLSGSGKSYLNAGNVGIGTTSPADKLHVNGGGILNVGTTNTYAIHMNADSGSGPILTFGNSTDYDAYGAIKHGSSQFQFLSYNRDYNFLNNGSSLMLIDVSTGRVGIGTTSPAASLHIEKTGDQASSVKGMVLSSGAAGTNKYLPSITWSYGASGTPDFARLEAQRGGGVSGRMLFSVANSSGTMTEAMRIDDAARVGIGTTIPDRNLHIYQGNSGVTGYPITGGIDIESTSITGINILSPNAGYGRIYFGAPISSTAGAIEYIHNATLASGYMKLRAGGGDRVFILGNGNVGIGTTSPSYKLDVNGSFRGGGFIADDSTFTLTFNSVNVLYGNLSYGTLPAASTFGTGDSGIVSDFPGSEVMRISSLGRVGINTTSPQANLHLNGSLRVDAPTNFANVGANLDADPGNGIIGNDPDGLGNDQNILGTPDTWLAVNINGTDYAIPAYAP
jgi:hypothetical protein